MPWYPNARGTLVLYHAAINGTPSSTARSASIVDEGESTELPSMLTERTIPLLPGAQAPVVLLVLGRNSAVSTKRCATVRGELVASSVEKGPLSKRPRTISVVDAEESVW